MEIRGEFHTDCDFQVQNFCAGTMTVVSDSSDFNENNTKGIVYIEYSDSSIYKLPSIAPEPLPPIRIKVTKCDDSGAHIIKIYPRLLNLWEMAFAASGLEISVQVDPYSRTVEGRYRVKGGMGMPRDEGVFHGILIL